MAIVSLVTLESQSSLKAEINKVLAPFGGLFDPAPLTVLLHIGSLYPAGPELGVNPTPELLTALMEWAYEAGAPKVLLAARAALGFTFAQSWQLAGYGALQNYGADIIDLGQAPCRQRESRLNLTGQALALPQPLLAADCLINICKFRADQGQLFGSALANLAALAVSAEETQLDARALVDLASAVMPDLHVADALRGNQGWQPQPKDALLAASDACALDMTLAALAGIPGESLEQLALAAQYGLGSANAVDIQLVGDTAGLFGLATE